MRMWMVPPEIMCQKHLGGEHLELHMFVGAINKGTHIHGFINNNLCEPRAINKRHKALHEEAERRGYNYSKPLPKLRRLCLYYRMARINRREAFMELLSRCQECNKRYLQWRENLEIN